MTEQTAARAFRRHMATHGTDAAIDTIIPHGTGYRAALVNEDGDIVLHLVYRPGLPVTVEPA
jgi:3-oxoacyl-(acyl-carrier-protein) synthase